MYRYRLTTLRPHYIAIYSPITTSDRTLDQHRSGLWVLGTMYAWGSIGIHKHTHTSVVKHKLDPKVADGHPCNTRANLWPCGPVDNPCITCG